jgi:hypothetical protein
MTPLLELQETTFQLQFVSYQPTVNILQNFKKRIFLVVFIVFLTDII